MKTQASSLAITIAVAVLLAACAQISTLKPTSSASASATVENPIIFGKARLSVVLGGKTYTGQAGESRNDTSGDQARRFGWNPEHRHPHIKQEMDFLFGRTTLRAVDGAQLQCDHLQHGDDWRLRCKDASGGEFQLQPLSRREAI
jgi:hypothetical protein